MEVLNKILEFNNRVNDYDKFVNKNSGGHPNINFTQNKPEKHLFDYIWKLGKDLNTPDISEDNDFSLNKGLKNFFKGLISPFTTLLESPKNLFLAASTILAMYMLTIATGGAIAPLLISSGLILGTAQSCFALFNILNAKNGGEREKLMYDLGSGVGVMALTNLGAKSALKSAGIATDGLNPFNATLKCFKSSPKSFLTGINKLKDGTSVINLKNTVGNFTQIKPIEMTPGEDNPLNLYKLEKVSDIKKYNPHREVQMSLSGYSAAPEEYENLASNFTEKLVNQIGKRKVSITTSPTAEAGSIDAIGTTIAQRKGIPLRYVTAEEYLGYIDKSKFPPGINKNAYDKATKFYFTNAKDYSAATAKASNSIVVEGGRNAAVSDFVNAIENGNKAVIVDLPVNTPWDANKNRVNNASKYIIEQLAHYSKNKKLKYPDCDNFTLDFLNKNYNKIQDLIKIVNIEDSYAVKQAAEHLNPSKTLIALNTLAFQPKQRINPIIEKSDSKYDKC